MKPIRTLPNCPSGLDDYLAQGGDPTDWDKFHDSDRDAYRELRDALVQQQHRLCGYCETSLEFFNVQIEHVIPKNRGTGDPARALDYTNLIACCTGIGQGQVIPSSEKGKINESCGQAKGEVNSPDFIDPRRLPALPGLFRVNLSDGTIAADETSCGSAGFPVSSLHRTVETLGLNAPRLKRERLNRINTLYDMAVEYQHLDAPDFGAVLESWARDELTPQHDGALPDFFTTRRSYFDPLSEEILAQPPQSWI